MSSKLTLKNKNRCSKQKIQKNEKKLYKKFQMRAGSMSRLCRQAAGKQHAQANLIVFWHCVHKASVNTHRNAKEAKTTP